MLLATLQPRDKLYHAHIDVACSLGSYASNLTIRPLSDPSQAICEEGKEQAFVKEDREEVSVKIESNITPTRVSEPERRNSPDSKDISESVLANVPVDKNIPPTLLLTNSELLYEHESGWHQAFNSIRKKYHLPPLPQHLLPNCDSCMQFGHKAKPKRSKKT